MISKMITYRESSDCVLKRIINKTQINKNFKCEWIQWSDSDIQCVEKKIYTIFLESAIYSECWVK